MKRERAPVHLLSMGVGFFLLLWSAFPAGIHAALPEVIYLGVVNSKDVDGHKVTLQTEQCFFGNSQDCDYVLTGKAPSEEAWVGIEVGDLVETRCFGGPGDAPGSWLFLGKLHSRADPVITDAYGDVLYSHFPWMGGFQVRYEHVPDCANCEEDPALPPICPTLFSEVTIDSAKYELTLGASATHTDGRYEVEVTFNSGDTRPWPECAPWGGWAGPQLVSDFTIHIQSSGAVNFRRGDADADNVVNISDGIFVLNYLFLGGRQPSCLDSTDTDDNGAVEVSDAVMLLGYLFQGGEPPADPFGSCGADSTEDGLICSEFPPCKEAIVPGQ